MLMLEGTLKEGALDLVVVALPLSIKSASEVAIGERSFGATDSGPSDVVEVPPGDSLDEFMLSDPS